MSAADQWTQPPPAVLEHTVAKAVGVWAELTARPLFVPEALAPLVTELEEAMAGLAGVIHPDTLAAEVDRRAAAIVAPS